MSAKPKAKPAAAEEKSPAPAAASPSPTNSKDPLIKTISEIENLSPEEKQTFRAAGGTSIQG